MDIYEFDQNVEEWRSRVANLLKQTDSVQHFAHESNQAKRPIQYDCDVISTTQEGDKFNSKPL